MAYCLSSTYIMFVLAHSNHTQQRHKGVLVLIAAFKTRTHVFQVMSKAGIVHVAANWKSRSLASRDQCAWRDNAIAAPNSAFRCRPFLLPIFATPGPY